MRSPPIPAKLNHTIKLGNSYFLFITTIINPYYRQKVVTAVFVVVLAVSIAAIIGFMAKVKVVLNVFAAFGFVFLFLFWLSGSIHFLVGMVLSDSCPILNNVTQGLLPTDGDAARVLNGCLYGHTTVLQSLNISAYNLSDAFDCILIVLLMRFDLTHVDKDNLNQFTNFAQSYNGRYFFQ